MEAINFRSQSKQGRVRKVREGGRRGERSEREEREWGERKWGEVRGRGKGCMQWCHTLYSIRWQSGYHYHHYYYHYYYYHYHYYLSLSNFSRTKPFILSCPFPLFSFLPHISSLFFSLTYISPSPFFPPHFPFPSILKLLTWPHSFHPPSLFPFLFSSLKPFPIPSPRLYSPLRTPCSPLLPLQSHSCSNGATKPRAAVARSC